MSQYHLIKRGLYYRPDAKGYTADIREAGTFACQFAIEEVASTHGEVILRPVPPVITSLDVEASRAGLWAAHTQLALHSLKAKVREFAAGVVPHPHPSKHGEAKVVGFDDRWSELLAELAKPDPVLPSQEMVRAILENP